MPRSKKKPQPNPSKKRPNNYALKLFSSTLQSIRTPLTCPLCEESVLCKHYEKHCHTQHDINPRLRCVWCQGQFSWRSMQKNKNVESHMKPCLRRLMNLQPSPDRGVEPELKESSSGSAKVNLGHLLQLPLPSFDRFDPSSLSARVRSSLLDFRHVDQAQCAFGHAFDPPPPSRAHHFPRPVRLLPHPLAFQDDALNLAVSCVHKFIVTCDTTEWFHVMVRIPVYSQFLKLIGANAGRTRTLPFACWCDGGQAPQARYRQHRHMLVVCSVPDHFLPNVWQKIKLARRPYPRYRALHQIPIKTALHLVHAIGYVSQRRSQCTFAGESSEKKVTDNHFHLARTLPRGYRLPLVLQWKDGLRQLLHCRCRNMKGVLVRAHDVRYVHFKWRLRVKDLPGLELGTVLPVEKSLLPCSYATSRYLHLMDGDLMYFDPQPEKLLHLDSKDWVRAQADAGNLFYHVVGEKVWTPKPSQQALLSEFRPLVDENQALTARVGRLELAAENDRGECDALRKEAGYWRDRCETSQQEVKELLKDEIARLREENERLRSENAHLRGHPSVPPAP